MQYDRRYIRELILEEMTDRVGGKNLLLEQSLMSGLRIAAPGAIVSRLAPVMGATLLRNLIVFSARTAFALNPIGLASWLSYYVYKQSEAHWQAVLDAERIVSYYDAWNTALNNVAMRVWSESRNRPKLNAVEQEIGRIAPCPDNVMASAAECSTYAQDSAREQGIEVTWVTETGPPCWPGWRTIINDSSAKDPWRGRLKQIWDQETNVDLVARSYPDFEIATYMSQLSFGQLPKDRHVIFNEEMKEKWAAKLQNIQSAVMTDISLTSDWELSVWNILDTVNVGGDLIDVGVELKHPDPAARAEPGSTEWLGRMAPGCSYGALRGLGYEGDLTDPQDHLYYQSSLDIQDEERQALRRFESANLTPFNDDELLIYMLPGHGYMYLAEMINQRMRAHCQSVQGTYDGCPWNDIDHQDLRRRMGGRVLISGEIYSFYKPELSGNGDIVAYALRADLEEEPFLCEPSGRTDDPDTEENEAEVCNVNPLSAGAREAFLQSRRVTDAQQAAASVPEYCEAFLEFDGLNIWYNFEDWSRGESAREGCELAGSVILSDGDLDDVIDQISDAVDGVLGVTEAVRYDDVVPQFYDPEHVVTPQSGIDTAYNEGYFAIESVTTLQGSTTLQRQSMEDFSLAITRGINKFLLRVFIKNQVVERTTQSRTPHPDDPDQRRTEYIEMVTYRDASDYEGRYSPQSPSDDTLWAEVTNKSIQDMQRAVLTAIRGLPAVSIDWGPGWSETDFPQIASLASSTGMMSYENWAAGAWDPSNVRSRGVWEVPLAWGSEQRLEVLFDVAGPEADVAGSTG